MRSNIQTVKFEVNAKNIRGQGRPRFAIIGGKPHGYKADEDKDWEKAIRDAWAAQVSYKDMGGFADEVRIDIIVYGKLPASARTERETNLCKPDIDNVAKSVLDALNRHAFKDDKQVTMLVVRKMPRTRRDDERMVVRIEYWAGGDN